MPNLFSWPALAASLLLAVIVGLQLGQSSVSLINPIYYQAPPLHPRDRGAAIDERALASARPAYAELYGWEEGYAARAADCGNCEALQVRGAYASPAVYSARVPYFGGHSEPRVTLAVAEDVYPDRLAARPDVTADPVVHRYAYYPVSAEAAAPAAPASASAPPSPPAAAPAVEEIGPDSKTPKSE